MLDMFESKKFKATLLGVAVALVQGFLEWFGFEIPPETLTASLSPILAYIVGQGIADHGKEREKVVSQRELEKLSD